jgi:hypothetical protein
LIDASILALLRSEEDTVRKAAAVKCIRAFPKQRVAKLLADHISGDHRYYNVLHWLDLGVSAPDGRGKAAAARAMLAALRR